MSMPNSIKTADIPVRLAAQLFADLNPETVVYIRLNPFGFGDTGFGALVSFVDPDELFYPEGWYFAKRCFRNKHTTTTGVYYEVPIYKPGGELW